jgi:hypothetical protein
MKQKLSKSRLKSLLILSVIFVGLATFTITKTISTIRAEQSGGSPSAGADSRLKQLADSLVTLNYGDPDNGAIADWGEYWNRVSSAAQDSFNDAKANGLFNGGNTDFPQNKGGIHDDTTLPTGSYSANWTTCNAGNNYCDTGETIAGRKDENTGLVWSERISASANWFTANNCLQPSNGVAPQGPDACSANGNPGCICTKLTESKTGCEAQGDGNWRLPYQKENMMAYIDGSAASLSNSAANHWSSTTNTTFTPTAWYTLLSAGDTLITSKTVNLSYRCVR